ncbi:putative glucuronoxylan glucuronosyltransferase F8H, partial [Tetrabaena socialis]
ICDDDNSMCYCPPETKFGRREAPAGSPPGTPPLQRGRPMYWCQPSSDKEGHKVMWGAVKYEDLYGDNGWCNADVPNFMCPCRLGGLIGTMCNIPMEQLCINQCSGRGECDQGFCRHFQSSPYLGAAPKNRTTFLFFRGDLRMNPGQDPTCKYSRCIRQTLFNLSKSERWDEKYAVLLGDVRTVWGDYSELLARSLFCLVPPGGHFQSSPYLGAAPKNRTTFLFFRGDLRMNPGQDPTCTYSRCIRQTLYNLSKSERWDEKYAVLLGDVRTVWGDYSELLARSLFCLVPPGQRTSRRAQRAQSAGRGSARVAAWPLQHNPPGARRRPSALQPGPQALLATPCSASMTTREEAPGEVLRRPFVPCHDGWYGQDCSRRRAGLPTDSLRDGWSPRPEDSILHGCIPVIIMDGVQAVFETILDLPSFSIRIAQKDMTRIIEILKAVSEERIKAMQDNLARVFRYLGVTMAMEDAFAASPVDDAFSTIMQWLYARIPDVHRGTTTAGAVVTA